MDKSLIKTTRQYEEEIHTYIKMHYGLSLDKLNLVNKNLAEIFKTALLVVLQNRGLIDNSYQESMGYFCYEGFFRVQSISSSMVIVEDLTEMSQEHLSIKGLNKIKKSLKIGSVFFGIVEDDEAYNENGKLVLYELLNEFEQERILQLTRDDYFFYPIDMLFEEVIMARITRKFLKPIEEIISNNEEYILLKYEAEDFALGTYFLTSMAKEAILKPGLTSIYEIDIKDHLIKTINGGFFLMEDSVEKTITFILDIYSLSDDDSKEFKKFYKDAQDLVDDVFVFKNLQKKSNPVTSSKLVRNLEQNISIDSFANLELFKLALFFEGLSELYEVNVSPKLKKITAASAREFFDEFYGSHLMATEDDYKLLEFVKEFFYTYGYIEYDEENTINFKNNIGSFLSPNPYILIGNIISGIFDPRILKAHETQFTMSTSCAMEKINQAIIDEDFSPIQKEKGFSDFLVILDILGLVELDYFDCQLTEIGQVYKNTIAGKNNSGKVLKLGR